MYDVPCWLITDSGLWRPSAEACCFVRPLFLFLIGSCTRVGSRVSLKRLFENSHCPEVASETRALLKQAPASCSALPSLSPVQQAAARLRRTRPKWFRAQRPWRRTVEVDGRGEVTGQNIAFPSHVTEVQASTFSWGILWSSSGRWLLKYHHADASEERQEITLTLLTRSLHITRQRKLQQYRNDSFIWERYTD